jgi:hypothetical protein
MTSSSPLVLLYETTKVYKINHSINLKLKLNQLVLYFRLLQCDKSIFNANGNREIFNLEYSRVYKTRTIINIGIFQKRKEPFDFFGIAIPFGNSQITFRFLEVISQEDLMTIEHGSLGPGTAAEHNDFNEANMKEYF